MVSYGQVPDVKYRPGSYKHADEYWYDLEVTGIQMGAQDECDGNVD